MTFSSTKMKCHEHLSGAIVKYNEATPVLYAVKTLIMRPYVTDKCIKTNLTDHHFHAESKQYESLRFRYKNHIAK